eukprot:CAMPEP_0194526020 /NCGR_PEP_ID=MMETSP0253-20130528/61702_1 /TAXON_ID=2966 /ORGANISM="Noctiluca scintillans" /LENGTH=36 /DNA_ID= /DNA_START= /DNA_END= /DNA_ORIENTATION=
MSKFADLIVTSQRILHLKDLAKAARSAASMAKPQSS